MKVVVTMKDILSKDSGMDSANFFIKMEDHMKEIGIVVKLTVLASFIINLEILLMKEIGRMGCSMERGKSLMKNLIKY